ncbi:MAG: tetratricopeptide repeat protein [Calditrichaeota bacterium]|nr:MAG: tetratricopeptide repeat protein [Calditrichota bacterium]
MPRAQNYLPRDVYEQALKLKANNRWLQLIMLLKPVMEQGNPSRFVCSTLGFAYSQLNRYDAARYCYKIWLEQNDTPAVPLYCLGYLEYDQGNWRAAVEWFDRALEEKPDYLRCWYRRGVALFQMERIPQSAASMQKVLDLWEALAPGDTRDSLAKYYYKGCFYRAKCHMRLGEPRQALRYLRQLDRDGNRFYTERAHIRYNHARVLFDLGHPRQALDILNKLEARPWIALLQARCLTALKQYDQAERFFDRAVGRRPQPWALTARADFWQLRGQPARAEQDLQRALERDRKGRHKILCRIARLRMQARDLPAAAALFRKALAFKQKNWQRDDFEALTGLAECYQLAGNEEKARELFARAAAVKEAYKDYERH